jgi:hypothetical protein
VVNLGKIDEKINEVPDYGTDNDGLSGEEIYGDPTYTYEPEPETREKTDSDIATVEVPLEALVKELGAERAVEFISEIRARYGDSLVESRKATEALTMGQIEAEVKTLENRQKT